ncbi:LuxR family transcriptional regulator [Xylanimonas allomyrinae]|uniref:LuxR family transcriptional regulator n=1 Tax=Xylanimonas allomyrinae TaxID=2509459 RepID=A0A4P6ELJ9_9MICO|nr:helix-turn-helix transcriptional regulator [Xylanimonas allomyrinae]QAY62573.1 LuxR family transcriptional regulator [Xylanimonas allomyrinae]
MLRATAVDLYLYICARGGDWTIETASEDLGLHLDEVEGAQAELVRFRLLTAVHAGGAEALVASAPDVALAELVDDDERQIQELRAAVTNHRRELLALLPAYRRARESAVASSQVETIEDPESVLRFLMDVGRRVTREVLIVQPGANGSVKRHEESNEKDRALLEQGVARRTLYHHRRRDHLPTQRTVAELEPLGAQFRTLPVVPFRMLIFDRQFALVARQRDAADRAALVFRAPDVVAAFAAVFDAAWEFASPFHASPDPEGAEGGDGLAALQRTILSGLSMGLTDQALAGRLGISVRTCRRHIAALFEQLGAESRFQAGVLAVGRGWIPPSTATRLAESRVTRAVPPPERR